MEKLKLILRPFLDTLTAWWYNLSSWTYNAILCPFLWQTAAFLAALFILLGIGGCGTTKIATVENKEITKVEIRDSIVYRDTTIYIPKERIVEVTPQLDTLRMEIDNAVSTAYLDTSILMLRGTLESKQAIQKEYVERIEYRDRTDTVYVSKPVPYEVEKPVKYVPSFYKFCLWWFIGSVILIALYVILKIKPF